MCLSLRVSSLVLLGDLDCLTFFLMVDWLDDMLTVNIVQVHVMILEMEVVKMDLVQVVLSENVFVMMVIVNNLLVLVMVVDDLLGSNAGSLEVFHFMGWNDL